MFDFGANYNLTTNDMTNRGFVIGRTGIGIFSYLFQLPDIKGTFPFIDVSRIDTSYLGNTIYENMLGGLIACNILLVLVLFVFKFRNILKQKKVYGIVLINVISAFILVLVDTQMAGILPRYIYDFSWIMFLAVTYIVFSLNEYTQEKKDKTLTYIWRTFLVVCLIWGTAYNFFRIFIDTAQQIEAYNPQFFYQAAHTIAFWL